MFKSRSQEKAGTPCVSLHGEKRSFLGDPGKRLHSSGYKVTSQLRGKLGKNVSGSFGVCWEVDFDGKKDWQRMTVRQPTVCHMYNEWDMSSVFWCGHFEKNLIFPNHTYTLHNHYSITIGYSPFTPLTYAHMYRVEV